MQSILQDKYIQIRSVDRKSNDVFNTFYEIPFVRVGDEDSYFVDVINVSLDNGVYPIHEFARFVYVSESGGATIPVSLTENNYTATQLATELQLQLVASLVQTYTVTYDTQSQRLTIVSNLPFQFQIVTTNTGATFDIYDEIGWDRNSLPATATQVGIGPVKLTGTDNVNIITNLGGQYITTSGKQRMLITIPMNVPFGSTVFFSPPDPIRVMVPSVHINNMAVQLWNDKDQLWELPNNMNYTITLQVTRPHPHRPIRPFSWEQDDYQEPPRHRGAPRFFPQDSEGGLRRPLKRFRTATTIATR